jgi:hypothetical protein
MELPAVAHSSILSSASSGVFMVAAERACLWMPVSVACVECSSVCAWSVVGAASAAPCASKLCMGTAADSAVRAGKRRGSEGVCNSPRTSADGLAVEDEDGEDNGRTVLPAAMPAAPVLRAGDRACLSACAVFNCMLFHCCCLRCPAVVGGDAKLGGGGIR